MGKITIDYDGQDKMDLAHAGEVDFDLEGSDWIRQSWTLDIHNADDLRAYLAAAGISIDEFKTWPVYQNNLEAEPWLKDL